MSAGYLLYKAAQGLPVKKWLTCLACDNSDNNKLPLSPSL